jgi:autotransporter adhesin
MTMAMASQITPSAPGRTTVSLGGGTYAGEVGTALNVVHRLNISTPLFLSAGVAVAEDGNWGGRIGIGMEF